MKKFIAIILLVAAISGGYSHAQSNAIGADDEFFRLLMQMGPELRPPHNMGSYTMMENLDTRIDDDLAYKYLWQKNQFVKPEETNCHPIGFVLNKETNVAILLFFKGNPDDIAFFVEVQTYNYKKGKLIDQLGMVAGFNNESSSCNMQVQSANLIRFKTVTLVGDTDLELKINNKGVIDRK